MLPGFTPANRTTADRTTAERAQAGRCLRTLGTAIAVTLTAGALVGTAGSAQATSRPATTSAVAAVAAVSGVSWSSSTAWAWAWSDLGSVASTDQFVQAQLSGLTSADRNGSVVLRRSGTSFVAVNVSGTRLQVSTVAGAAMTSRVNVAFAPGTAGTLRAQLTGTTLKVYWNGVLVNTSTQSAYGLSGTGTGLGVWQTAAKQVLITGAVSGVIAAPTAPPTSPPTAPVAWSSSTAWAWAWSDLGSIASKDQFVQATLSGLTSADRNGAVLLRKSGTEFVAVNVSGSRLQVSTVAGAVMTSRVNVAFAPGATGTLRAQLTGTTLNVYWNGALVTTSTQSAYGLGGTGTGLGVWQTAAKQVLITGAVSGAIGTQPPTPTPTPTPTVTPTPTPTPTPAPVPGTSKAVAMYGTPRSGLAWHSGFWTGGSMSTTRMKQAEAWVGRPFDFVTTYPAYATWAQLGDSDWSAGLFDGFGGRLSYGLPLLPVDRRGQWSDVTSGAHDATFATIAKQLVAHGRGDSVIRVGLEANGNWFPWAVTAGTASQYKAAFQRVVTVMRAEAPKLTFWFDLAAGSGLGGQTNRMDTLNLLYPGDAYVDGVSMDHYDFYGVVAKTDAQWANAVKPPEGAGLADGVAFARAHHKGFGVPEWGLHSVQGAGDNPFFVQKMHDFFVANKDVLVFENYFNEPDVYIANSLFSPVQLPKSSALYTQLFRR